MNKKDESLRRQRTNLTLGPKVKAWAENYCRGNEKSLSNLVNDLLRKYLEEHDPKGRYKQVS